jgi:hypothetical protein
MTEQKREIVGDSAFAIVQVRMAHTACLDAYERLVWPWVRHENRFHPDWRTPGTSDHALDCIRHRFSP